MSSSEEELERNVSEEEEASEDEIPEEEEEEEDEEDEEEDETPVKKRKAVDRKPPKPKKRRKPVNKFIEEEADVDEDEEEEEDEEEDDDLYRSERQMAEEVEAGHHSYRYEPQDRTQFDESESAEAIVNRIKKRHQQSRKQYDGDEDGGEVVQSEVAQQSLLPSIQDPRMWVFKCKPGHEQNLVVALMKKFIEFSRRGEPLMIKSVVASNSKGFIYVEAEREPHAKNCLTGLRDVQQWSMKLVPIHEMTSVLNVQTRRKPLVAGAWARIKRAGMYKGDLCKIVEILDNGSRAVVKMIPRLDPIVLAGGEQPKYKRGQRPPQKLFHANMVPGADLARRRYPSTGEMMDSFDNDFYQDGFLIKEVNIATMLSTEDLNPTLEDINRFSSVAEEDGEHTTKDMLASVEADDWKSKVELTKGDTVRVIEGDLINLMGVVLSTNSANDTVRVMPLHEEIKDTILDFQLKQLMKYVKVGDHIKVVSGMYSGETGTVVAVDDSEGAPVAVVLVDSMAREIQVRVRDLQESAEISQGLDSYKGKELYDLVALAHGDVGMITHVGREGFTVLCQNGQSRTISDQEVQRKIVSSRATAALDKKHNHVSVGEMVNVVEGPFSGHSGTVKHIYRTYLFIHNNRIATNSGIFVARARGVILSGSKARSDMISNSTVPRMDAGMRQQNQRGGRNQRESELIGQTVKVKKGRWKGYIGIVVDESDQKVKVEIHCKAKVVDIDRLHITVAGTRDGGVVDKPRYAGTPMTGATPLPSQTPLHGSAMTPMATPLHRGMGTPEPSGRGGEAWNVANDDALLETQMNQEKDITHATSFGTPLEPMAPTSEASSSRYSNPTTLLPPRSPSRDGMMPVTPAANAPNSGLNPTTPGLQPRTPAYLMGQNPTTPGLNPTTPGLNPTTPAHLSAATPGMGHEPMGMEPMTPGFNPATPGLSAMTPGLNPVTPGMNTPGYNHNPMTPGFSVGTPMGRMNSALTPAATPGMLGGNGMPMTPVFNQDVTSLAGGSAGGDVTWKVKGVEVEVIAGEHKGSVGAITSASGGTCSIDVDGRVIAVPFNDVRPVVPEKQDTVIILSGDEAGMKGSLIGTDASDGIVKVDGGSEIKIYAIALLAKIAQ
uniref:Transcription elongation factor SPT5 n=1 Tax=Peronospora matthiolae TaxID=2874970 RepID=A0AAV1UIT8_9STRA